MEQPQPARVLWLLMPGTRPRLASEVKDHSEAVAWAWSDWPDGSWQYGPPPTAGKASKSGKAERQKPSMFGGAA